MAVSTRQALLQALSAAGGSYVSGQQLAETLGVSRAAVHKAAAALAAQGYALEAAPRRATGWRAVTRSAPKPSGTTLHPSIYMTRWKAPTARQSCWRWMVHPMARWCSPPTRAPDAAGWAGDLKARQARAFTALCCCARKCPPPMPRPLPSAPRWRSAVP